MNNGPSYFEIQSDDTAKARNFYEKVFGWKFTEQKGLPVEYWRIETGSSGGGLLKRPAKTPPMECGTNAYTNSMEVKNFDETAKKITDNGGVVAMPKFAIPGLCYQGYFLDTDNNVFGIFQPDTNAK